MAEDIFKDKGDLAVDALRGLLRDTSVSYEIFFSGDSGLNVEAREGSVDALKVRSSRGVGLRVVSDGRPGFAFTSVLDRASLEEMVRSAIAGSKGAAEDKFLGFPSKPPGAGDLYLDTFDASYGAGSEREKIDAALKIEEAALSYDKRVRRVRKASYGESVRYARVVNSNGLDVSHSATFYSASVTAVAEENGSSEMGWEMDTSHKRASIDPARVGIGAAHNAVRMLGARRIKTLRCPAVIENTVVCELLEALANSFLADNVHKGKSMLIGKAGKKVASSALSVWDDGLLRGGWASAPYDGEGSKRQKTGLLVNGVCGGWLYDTYWAKRDSAASTGNAVRTSYKGTPAVGVSNLYIEAGSGTLEGLFKDVGNGLFITEVLGVHTINTVSGDFSLGAAGFKVEGGALAYPVRSMAISGNLMELFSKVARAGGDMRFIGSIGAPSLCIEEIEASGS